MTDSMTAFARTEASTEFGDLSLELRSVNHRYLETVFRLPEELRRFETRFRELIGKRLARGRVDVNIRFRPAEAAADGLTINDTAVAQLRSAAARVAELAPDATPLAAIDIMNWPGVVQTRELEPEKLGNDAVDLLRQALDELCEIRRREGEGMNLLISERLVEMARIVESLRPLRDELETRFRHRLNERLESVRDELDPGRLEQEVVLYLQKSDTDEELDRLVLHIEEVTRVLGEKKPVGRRLDFLMQELNREANTLGSKAADPRVTRASVDLKVLIEQSREQVQNIE